MTKVTRHRVPPKPLRQRGSTLTGLIIGLIVGLGIAVAVALTITKGASPFTEKTAKSGRPADPAPGQAMDPNKPMYGNREAARQANREVNEKAAARGNGNGGRPAPDSKPASNADADPLGQMIAGLKEPAQQPDARSDSRSDSRAESRAEPRSESRAESRADARADARAESRADSRSESRADTRDTRDSRGAAAAPAARTASAPAASGDTIYYLQAGAFREMSDAEATRARLALLGFEAAISDRTSDSGVLHRVRMGPFNQVETMNKARAKLIDNGVDVAIVRNQR